MKLVIEDEAGTRSIVPFAGDGIVVGRGGEGVTFRLPDRDVSRRHARFLVQGGAVYVEDLGSLNGTRVNGERIGGRRRLRDGDLVQIGEYDLAVLAEGVALAPGAPPPLPPPPGRGEDTASVAAPIDPTPPSLSPSWTAPPPPPRPGRGRAVKIALAAGALALALGLALGWAAGALGN